MGFLNIVLGFVVIGLIIAIFNFIKEKIKFVAGKTTETPLMKAAIAGDVIQINELLLSGVDIDEKNAVKDTALSLAIIKNQEETACVLINAGANLIMACRDGKDAFDLVLESKNERILLQLIEKTDTKTLVRFNLLLAVVEKNFSVDVLRALFDKIEQEQKGVSAKIREGNEYSDIDGALWKAAENGNIQNVDFLLEKGASLAIEPIWAAVRSNSVPLVKKFIELGDNIEAKDSNGITCLALAVIRLEYEIMELLLENNANPNISFKHPTYNYLTSLLSYAKQETGGKDRVLLLEKYGAKK